MEPASFLGGIFDRGLWTLMPLLSVAAVIDIVRTRAEWYWIWVVLFFQGIGPIAYFAVSYGPWSAGSVGQLSPAAARRVEARRRLRELQIQLGHWRGPSVLAEAGEQLLALGRYRDAEAHLREAKEAGAGPKEANLALAQLFQIRGARYAESRPLLEELDAEDPDYRFGAARLALARSLDETGEAEAAETLLRALIEKRNLPEGKVRLARLLMRRGEAEEARELLLQLGSDGATMP
ncbi:MAG: PLDc N-terminal domain-containing protein, partial [Holophagales bacterium]|nr:PLDc N-terminal domain-containing protein [Holophagales bacterium]